MSINPRIIIVGAGASGYAAACKLLEHGFRNIKIFEAENRIGGRIHSVSFGSGKVDLGAQWCHGEKDNIVYNLAKDLNVLQHSLIDFTRFVFVNSKGSIIDTNVSDRLTGLLFSLQNNEEELKVQTGSLGDYIVKRYNEELKTEYSDIDSHLTKQILDWFHKLESNLNGAINWYEISANGTTIYKDCEGDLTLDWKNLGFATIFSILKKEIPDPCMMLPTDDYILKNKEVIEIIWPKNISSDNHKVTVKCKDGTSYNVDHVIVTISLAVLKKCHQTMFTPELPDYKKNAIEGLSMDAVNKILLKFPTKWWPEDCSGYNLLWTVDDSKTLISEFPEGPNKNGKSWLESIFGFHPIANNPTILMAWYNGELSAEIELLSDDVVRRGCMFLLRKFLGKHFVIPEPENLLRSAWYTNSHFRGSYSYRSLKSDQLNVTAADLAKPLGDNSLLFAGEATHPYYYSTVHGAIETGFREAERIITYYDELKSSASLRYKVVIIGAGISGLAAAVTLAQSGCKDIVLLEAQDAPGGRIKTVPLAGGYIDLGAQWLHGDGNALWKISNEHDLISKHTVYEGRGVYLREDGYKFDSFLVEKVQFIVGEILEECEHFVNSTDAPDSVGKYLDEKFTDYIKSNSLNESEMTRYLELYDWNVRFQVIDNCCHSLYNVSAKYWGKYFCPVIEGQAHINYSTGHSSVIDVLVKKLPENVLVTNRPVVNIDWTGNDSNESVIITCHDGSHISSDAVIVTSSLGVLKHTPDLFTPKLPVSMTEIIDAMGFAAICKIFLLFEEKWWDSEGIQLIWKYNREYDNDWIRYLSGFDLVLDQENMLLGWIGGHGANLVENVPEEVIGKRCGELFRMFTRNMQIPDPVKVIRSTWSSNKWIRGGYCHTTPKCDQNDLLPERLQEPVRNKSGAIKILLAGEHTHSEHFSTTHGAYESGIRQAKTFLSEMVP